MRVLLDEHLPHDLISALAGHEVMTVQGLGWAGIQNGELLRRAAGQVDAFVTMDRKLEHEHDLGTLSFGVVVIRARSNRVQDLRPLIGALREALARLGPGEIERVGREPAVIAHVAPNSRRFGYRGALGNSRAALGCTAPPATLSCGSVAIRPTSRQDRTTEMSGAAMSHPIHRVEHFKIVGPYTLALQFDDGSEQRIDFRPVLEGQVFGPLQDPKIFNAVVLDKEAETLTWPNGADFDPAALHDWPQFRDQLAAMARGWAERSNTAHRNAG